ncbi:hypothetical protein DERF_012534 [Dermatophagoides farinae]|uniref:Uncharacterized protein n=1 Tax=Dermatophagoides farinae TaxID=6954 RepID=A0A922KXJ6_DERFA|nr:hypothetical protein DERF_012534 [Dermatophagoides farinae]
MSKLNNLEQFGRKVEYVYGGVPIVFHSHWFADKMTSSSSSSTIWLFLQLTYVTQVPCTNKHHHHK